MLNFMKCRRSGANISKFKEPVGLKSPSAGIIDFIRVFHADKIQHSPSLYGLIFKFYDNFDAKSIDYGTG